MNKSVNILLFFNKLNKYVFNKTKEEKLTQIIKSESVPSITSVIERESVKTVWSSRS